jgi:hypothetical protein
MNNKVLFRSVAIAFLSIAWMHSTGSVVYAHDGPTNLNFEDATVSESFVPQQWSAGNKKFLHHYKETIVDSGASSGSHALRIASIGAPAESESVSIVGEPPRNQGNVSQFFDAAPYRGKIVKFSIDARRDSGNCEGRLWMMVERNGQILSYTENRYNPVTTSKWDRYQVTLEIDTAATTITIGCVVRGEGVVFFDDASFKTVSKEAQLANGYWGNTAITYVDFNLPDGKKRTVLASDILRINGSWNGGVLIMNGGEQIRYSYFPKDVIEAINNPRK